MFNKKLKQENRMLRLDNSDLSNELDRVNKELELERANRLGEEFHSKHLKEIIQAQGELLVAFSEYIVDNLQPKKTKKVKIKKGAKHGKKK